MATSPAVLRLIELALEEDLGRGDVTTEILEIDAGELSATVVAREPLVVFGLSVAALVFQRGDSSVQIELLQRDGERLEPGQAALRATGRASSILTAERIALNFVQRLSGVATMANRFASAVEGTEARVVDTRKTTPGYRVLEKAAVRAGGCHNHRADLGSGILIKDNHIVACGSVTEAVTRALAKGPHGLRVEIEVDTDAQLDEAIAAGAHIVLLDNMSVEEVKEAAKKAQAAGLLVEVSGGVTLATVGSYARAGADVISAGAITHSAPAVDLGLDIR
ncbi:MAG: carboxylating nicotinate-nucleotide diphosphorylase [Myxococcales bacterium]|nr:carboxylating nicotinate-nucleotide diphosphorylase [Myxococcales bacterium]